jgi:sugar lactone lactonase YvrE
MTSKPICVAATGDWVGEGAVWHNAQAAVFWTDINRFLIHRLTPADQCVKTWIFDEPVTALTLTDRDDVVLAVLASRVILWEPATDMRRDQGFRLEGWPKVRFNDARADSRGSLWLGSMRNNVNPGGSEVVSGGKDGILYRLDPDGTSTVFLRDIGISNTVAWSPDRRHFYFADSLANTIWVFEYDAAAGTISNQRPFLKDHPRGLSDGSTVDAEGFLWNCRYSGGCILRISPGGKVDRVIEMPIEKHHHVYIWGCGPQDTLCNNCRSGSANHPPAGRRTLRDRIVCHWAAGEPLSPCYLNNITRPPTLASAARLRSEQQNKVQCIARSERQTDLKFKEMWRNNARQSAPPYAGYCSSHFPFPSSKSYSNVFQNGRIQGNGSPPRRSSRHYGDLSRGCLRQELVVRAIPIEAPIRRFRRRYATRCIIFTARLPGRKCHLRRSNAFTQIRQHWLTGNDLAINLEGVVRTRTIDFR